MPTFKEDLHLGHKVPLIESDDISDGAITSDKIADGAILFRHLSLDALEGIKAWLEGHPGPTPPGPTPTTFNIYFGFANPAEIEGVEGLEVREAEELAGEYDATNERDGNQFYMVLPSNIVLENGQLKIKDNPFYFPTRVDTTLEIDGKSYTRYITNGDDLGYKAGFYPFVIE